mgnify:CR=1 FL=1
MLATQQRTKKYLEENPDILLINQFFINRVNKDIRTQELNATNLN